MYPVQGYHQHLSLLRWTRQVLTPFTCHGVSQNQKEVRIIQYPVEIDSVYRASDISRGRGPAKFKYFREIPRNSPKKAKYREIRQKYFQIHVGKTYLILILAIRPVLFTPNVQIYLETSSLQGVKNVPKLPGVFR